ncbi:mannose-6-phosphate isomerase-like protein (cupin superfamily) [Nocardia kruczakiae]|uniref:Mannose-6-phosphate isomerase-like protein (Cupin superfamily) n=1 Tax=Nocardia kruczakiae TaxID=261477 RepID=A0ABU1X952_9NOCA|nr:cupin domain-containing protein [Nocardia kruczakiae]MDR7167065.1 mannose-6-phosphate isomerase-like protein (cupin superfamily) [Nocardia kruczakiae]
MTASAQTAPVLVRADQAENLQDGALSLITLLTDAGQTGGALTANKATLRKGSPGAPAHFHTAATEMFLVLNGSVRILLGENIVRLEQGDFLTVPPTVPHAFAPAAGADAELLVVFTPGLHRFDYYRLLERVHRGEASVEEIRAISQRYDNHYVDSPVWRNELADA